MALALHGLFSTGAYVCTEEIYTVPAVQLLFTPTVFGVWHWTHHPSCAITSILPRYCYLYRSIMPVQYDIDSLLIHYIPRIFERKATSSSTINTNHALNDRPAECINSYLLHFYLVPGKLLVLRCLDKRLKSGIRKRRSDITLLLQLCDW